MKRYGNLSGDSGVIAYEIKLRSLIVKFQDGLNYEYTVQTAGAAAIAKMKLLAESGKGLSTYISRHVKDKYARKFR